MEVDTTMNTRSLILVGCACMVYFALHTPVAVAQVPADRDLLLGGGESGQERPAEVNGFPGPARVLELDKQLRLTDEQKKSLRAIADDMRKRAVELGKRIVGIEEELNEAFRTGMVNEQSIRDDAEQIGRLRGKLRTVRLTAHFRARKVLTAEQLSAYRNLKSQKQEQKQEQKH